MFFPQLPLPRHVCFHVLQSLASRHAFGRLPRRLPATGCTFRSTFLSPSGAAVRDCFALSPVPAALVVPLAVEQSSPVCPRGLSYFVAICASPASFFPTRGLAPPLSAPQAEAHEFHMLFTLLPPHSPWSWCFLVRAPSDPCRQGLLIKPCRIACFGGHSQHPLDGTYPVPRMLPCYHSRTCS